MYVVPGDAIREVVNELERASESATRQLGLPTEPPIIYLYPGVEPLREYSCGSPLPCPTRLKRRS